MAQDFPEYWGMPKENAMRFLDHSLDERQGNSRNPIPSLDLLFVGRCKGLVAKYVVIRVAFLARFT